MQNYVEKPPPFCYHREYDISFAGTDPPEGLRCSYVSGSGERQHL